MPSPLTVPVAIVDKVLPHSNADRLEIVHVLGWQCIISKGSFQPGDKVVYFPIDTVLPETLSDELGVTQYLSKGRIRACRLRGEKSFGLVVKPAKASWAVGKNVADYYKVTKYEPPRRGGGQNGMRAGGQHLPELAGFPKYTEIDNARHYPNLIQEDELIVITEKIHGTNSRVGMVHGKWMAGSHRRRRARPFGFLVAGELDTWLKQLGRWWHNKWDGFKAFLLGVIPWRWLKKALRLSRTITDGVDLYWFPLSLRPVSDLVRFTKLMLCTEEVVVYGEIFGPGIQGLHYGVPKGQYGYRVFDIKVDGQYLNWSQVTNLCSICKTATVPVLYEGPRSGVNLANMSEGTTLVWDGCGGGKRHIREGVVVKPQHERTDPRLGRVILKYVSDTYLLKKIEDFAEE